MTEIKVLNKYKDGIPSGSIYIGRPSIWGNPFSHINGTLAEFKVNNRDEAVESYRAYLYSNPELMAKVKQELRGKNLVCFCAPKSCHGDVLLEVANSE